MRLVGVFLLFLSFSFKFRIVVDVRKCEKESKVNLVLFRVFFMNFKKTHKIIIIDLIL